MNDSNTKDETPIIQYPQNYPPTNNQIWDIVSAK